MNHLELVLKWIEELRSGNWVQIRSMLKPDLLDQHLPSNGRCCLGVLCELIGENYTNCSGYEIIENLKIPNFPEFATLYAKNDGILPERSHSFDDIADYIEKTLLLSLQK